MRIPWTYNIRSLFVRKATTFATAAGIGLVVYVLASALMLSAGIKKTLVSSGDEGSAIILRKGSETELASGVEQKYVSLIKAAPGVKRSGSGEPLVMGDVVVVVALDKVGTDGLVSNVQVRGVDPNVTQIRPQMRVVAGRAANPGTDEAIVGLGMRGRFKGLELGQSFELKKNRPIKVVGVFEANKSSFESEIWVDVETLRTSFGREGLYSSVTAVLESPSQFDAFAATIESDKQLGLEAKRETKYYEDQSSGTAIFVSALGSVISFFFSLGAMIGAMITMYAAVSQRSREIGTLQALGFTRGSVLVAFLFESTVLALIGGVVGALASLLMSFVKFNMMNFQTWQEISFSFEPTLPIVLGSLLAGALMGVLGGLFPALKAARTSPIDAIRAG
jgi:putative ABC transport system permease protein